MIFPYLFIYLRYNKISDDITIIIDHTKKKIITYMADYCQKNYSFDDIKTIQKVSSWKVIRHKYSNPQKGDFYYFIIEMKNAEEIIITSLMTNDEKIEIAEKPVLESYETFGWIRIKGRIIVNLQLKNEKY